MMEKRESLRFTWLILFYCVLFMLLLAALYALYLAAMPKRNAGALYAAASPREVRVIVDAGHGGRDGGATGVTGLLEKELNLEISNTLGDILLAAGVETRLTRRADSLVCDEIDPTLKGKLKQTDLKNRAALAAAFPQALFISIHMNNFPVEKYSGLQVYYSVNNENSLTLATLIQSRVAETLQPDNTRRVKAAGSNIFLLDRIHSPAVLVECGFLSNYAESKKLADAAYRKELAALLAVCLMQNLREQP